MARALVALSALVLLAGCASTAENALPAPAGAQEGSAGEAQAVGGEVRSIERVGGAEGGDDACPLSNDDIDDFPGGFQTVQGEAASGDSSGPERTVYAECPTAFRWATTVPSPDGLFVGFTIAVPDETDCLATFLAGGADAQPGPLTVAAVRTEYGAGWGMGSTGPLARVQVLGVDSNDVLWGDGGQWAGASGLGFGSGTWELTFASQAVSAWDNDLTEGWAAAVGVTCEAPFEVSDLRAARAAALFDQSNLGGGASAAAAFAAGATVQGEGAAELEGDSTTVFAGAFSGQAWRLALDHPKGSEEALVLPSDDGTFVFRGEPGAYTATLDKVDGLVFNTWWLLMAGGEAMESLASFE
jgi:hypothetical protein